MHPTTALVLGLGLGICVDPVLRGLLGTYGGLIGLGLALGAAVVWLMRERP